MLFNLSDQNSVAAQFLYELRDQGIQKDRMRFRRNLERLGEILAYEISKHLTYKEVIIETPVSSCNVRTMAEMPLLINILRAGLPFAQGFLNFFSEADTGFIGAYRKEGKDKIEIIMDYIASPSLEGRDVIIVDPMLATGSSVVRTLQQLLKDATPRRIHLAAVIAAPEGINLVSLYAKELKMPFHIWTAAVDEKLNDQFYIVPGLGDAGDLSFGIK